VLAKTNQNLKELIVLNGKCPCERPSIRCYNFVIVGSTGAGKTTFCDSLINYLMGVEFFDQFRYKLIDERIQSQGK